MFGLLIIFVFILDCSEDCQRNDGLHGCRNFHPRAAKSKLEIRADAAAIPHGIETASSRMPQASTHPQDTAGNAQITSQARCSPRCSTCNSRPNNCRTPIANPNCSVGFPRSNSDKNRTPTPARAAASFSVMPAAFLRWRTSWPI